MAISDRDPAQNVRRKNRFKRIKTVVQAVVLLGVAMLIYRAVWGTATYAEPDKRTWNSDHGFVALSYFGVGRSGTPKLIAKNELNSQLKALHNQGYRTISQQDILDYYGSGKPLPDKALFLSFEDGRNDSALFAEPMLEKYNFKATFLSYAGKLGNGDNKFVQAKEMLKLRKSGFWELGSNGYRLSYINVFDNDGSFLGQKTEKELKNKSEVAYYNHYLMDFVRDENMIPTEDRGQMEARIGLDYKLMRDVYTDKLGYVPGLYMIMHANSLGGGMNRLVTDANEKEIEALFRLHFAREGGAFNGKSGSVYDLTRVQSQPYWSTNHLLMAIGNDSGQKMTFVQGEKSRAADWTALSGAAEFDENEIVLTSPAGAEGMAYLKGSDGYGDVSLTAKLTGNVVGKQSLYLRYDREKDAFVRVALADNEIAVEQKKPGQAVERLFGAKLSDVTWDDEDLALSKAAVYTKAQTAAGLEPHTSIPANIAKSRRIGVELAGGKLRLKVDGKTLLGGRAIDASIAQGGVALSSEASKQNEKDDIYDGRFVDVTVKSLGSDGGSDGASGADSHGSGSSDGSGDREAKLLYRNTNEGLQGMISGVKHGFNRVVDWFIDTF
ncbi:polysaccharide deacetylase family protein [Paenibacillus sacheonensis]|uniref:Polysaccharide deacetylase n=1 Tax=Paenibacillus sacheonensis TaxID=742054 RepID=A0A7X5BZW5_9BACL|nr:polysaccharide deacetylase family protein [Paenibacillus sacheonensis]MBM7567120.1 peptidoglycan/xylan/chitin deacetylase (PgdA/CDA1 family) [Paenibacillus sacheonensis]NBC70951.1 polysaccharide deacetylase [Paenibacillus sacheonensis]